MHFHLRPFRWFWCWIAMAAFLHAETRYHEATRRFENPTDGVRVVSAGFFGGGGHEWLSAAAFRSDGSIVLAGNFIGPDFRGATVLGRDCPKPAAAQRKPATDRSGKPLKNDDGSPKWRPLGWDDEGVTGFILLCDSDLQQVLSVSRLPFQGGSITSCVATLDGGIFIAGKAGAEIGRIAGEIRELECIGDRERKSSVCEHVYLARLGKDGSTVEWLRHFKGPSGPPSLSLLADGSLALRTGDLRTFSPAGEETGRVSLPDSLDHLLAFNLKDGSYATGGEHHSPTGREPWRCPKLNIFAPDGTHLHQLYDWGGPYVGLDNLRLVSDTAVKRVTLDNEGNLFVTLWSDGGNSVALREPFDIRTMAPGFGGLGFSAWGAGVLSAAYLLRIDPQSYEVMDGTLWLAYLEHQNKPNSAWVDQVAFAPDGSVCFAGRAASSVVQTGNRLGRCQRGQHVAILNRDMTSLRFCSTIPGGGAVRTGGAEETWSIAASSRGMKQRVLFVTGSSGEAEGHPTPTLNAAQPSYGGGWTDGYALLLEMDHLPGSKRQGTNNAGPVNPAATTDGNSSRPAQPDDFLDKRKRGPRGIMAFHFEPAKWMSADAEIRDPSGKLWPTFFYGKPDEGTLRFDNGALDLKCRFEFTHACQPNGRKDNRIAGEWIPEENGKCALMMEIQGVGQPRVVDGGIVADADVLLRTDNGTIPLKAICRFTWKFGKSGELPESVQVDVSLLTTGRELGFRNPLALGPVRIRAGGVASVERGE